MPGPRPHHWEEWSWDLNSVCLTTSSKFSALLTAKALCESPDMLLPSSMCHLPCVRIQPLSSSIVIVLLPAQKPPEATVRRRPLSLALIHWLNLPMYGDILVPTRQAASSPQLHVSLQGSHLEYLPSSCLLAQRNLRFYEFFWLFESVSIYLLPLNYHFTWYMF